MTDYSPLWDEEATSDEVVECYQALIDNGQAWRLEGHVGRTAKALIDAGQCMLGEVGHNDAYGNYIPSRHEIEPGYPGSAEYCERIQENE